jgi:hypothetical protein
MAIDRRMDSGRVDRTGGLLLLFERSGRPNAADVRAAVERLAGHSISHDPSAALHDVALPQPDTSWLELLCNGMTYDLTNLAPGKSANIPDIRSSIDLPDDLFETTQDAISLLAGLHLSGGINSIPVVRMMLELAASLASVLPRIRAVCWSPAAVVIRPEVFGQSVESWVKGGPYPAQVLTGFKKTSDGGLQIEGLAFFTGQEIRIEPDSIGDVPTATQLAGRLVQQLVQHGPLNQTEEVIAPDGSQMRLEPSGNKKFVRVWRS